MDPQRRQSHRTCRRRPTPRPRHERLQRLLAEWSVVHERVGGVRRTHGRIAGQDRRIDRDIGDRVELEQERQRLVHADRRPGQDQGGELVAVRWAKRVAMRPPIEWPISTSGRPGCSARPARTRHGGRRPGRPCRTPGPARPPTARDRGDRARTPRRRCRRALGDVLVAAGVLAVAVGQQGDESRVAPPDHVVTWICPATPSNW